MAIPFPVTCPHCRQVKVHLLDAGGGRTVAVDLGDDPHGEVEYRGGRAYPVGVTGAGNGRRFTPHGCQQARTAKGALMLGNVIVLPGRPAGAPDRPRQEPTPPEPVQVDEVTAARQRRWKSQLPSAEQDAVAVLERAGFEIDVLAPPTVPQQSAPPPARRSGGRRAAR